MNNNHAPTSESREMLLGRAANEYFAAAARGEQPSVREFAARYPLIADDIQRTFSAVALIGDLRSATDATDPQIELGRELQLGDFRILRELGRGGMGVVYEAEQLSLGRHVALKVLPFASVLDKQQIRRFQNEARAAATLDHPGIVSIYSVGCERSVHFYAMQLIEGQTLADVIRELRQLAGHGEEKIVPDVSQLTRQLASGGMATPSATPSAARLAGHDSRVSSPPSSTSAETRAAAQAGISTDFSAESREYFRTVAQLGIQAAEALDHAHQHGVLHRDIKPGNLMLDTEGHLWITDFGLARVEAEPGITMTGDLLGTLRYMSPEQALAKRGVVDHRADVYSLGVTLYELLTLEPALKGEGRQSLLQQIAFEEPPSPCQINQATPTDLGTIVLKAIRKNAAERYSTAQELASDLNRFLNHEPIQATLPTLSERVTKWRLRHPGLARGLLVMLAAVVLCLLVSTVLISGALSKSRRAQRAAVYERDQAEAQRKATLSNLYVAQMRLAHEEWQRGHLASVVTALDAHVPTDGRADRRGWEWYYLKSLCHKDLLTLPGHTAAVTSVAWSPDGQRLASAGEDWTVKVWDVATERELTSLRGHENWVSSLAWSAGGRHLASGGWDETIRVWDLETGILTLKIAVGDKNADPEIDNHVRSIGWSPDGTHIAGSFGDTIGTWDATSGRELWRAKIGSLIKSIAWSPDGTTLASGENYETGALRIWDATSGRQMSQILHAHAHAVTALAWSPGGRHLASASGDHHLKIWDADTWREIHLLSGHEGVVRSLDWNPSGELLSTGGDDGKIVLWDAGSGRQVRTLRAHRGAVNSVRWRSDGQRLASGSNDRTVKIWDPHREQDRMSLERTEHAASWSPDGKRFALAGHSGSVVFYAADTGQQIRDVPIPSMQRSPESNIYSLAWSPEGQRLAAAFEIDVNSSRRVKVWEVDTWKELLSLDGGPNWRPGSVAWNPEGSLLATAGHDGQIRIWNSTTGKQVAALTSHQSPLGSVAWSPDGSRLATASWNQIVKIWDTSTWREMLHLDRHPGDHHTFGADGNYSVAWSPAGDRLAAGSVRGLVIVWDATTGREILGFSAHATNVRCVAWSPNGRRLATGSSDHTVKIWDADTGVQLLTLRGHLNNTVAVAWSPSGRQLLSCGAGADSSNVSILWDASAGYAAASVPYAAQLRSKQ